jgi:VWFA-related protein
MRAVNVILTVIAAAGMARPPQSPATGDLVEIDLVALDRDNRPVYDLGPDDFQVREDGHVVDVKTFSAPGRERDDERAPRQLVLLLDDSSVPMGGTPVIQAMAKAVLSRGTLRDEVTVVRLNNPHDEPYGDLETALSRIDHYAAGAVPFQNRGTADRLLHVVASIAKQLDGGERRRKLIVCIGGPRVCNVLEPERGYGLLWRPWIDAVTNASRANVAVYAIMPVPIGTPMMLAGGLADMTGGDGFANTSSFEAFVNRLWVEARDYYLLGYWPTADARELHSVDVKVKRKGVHVLARRTRG